MRDGEIIFIFYYAIFVFAFFACLATGLKAQGDVRAPVYSPKGIFPGLFICFVICVVGFWPDDVSPDKPLYRWMYESVSEGQVGEEHFKDFLFFAYLRIFSFFRIPADVFFLITASIFCLNFLYAGRRIFREQYALFFFASVVAMGFLSYGTNTLRAGLALSFFCQAIVRYPSVKRMLPWGIIAVGIHHSLIIPVCALIVAWLVMRPKFLMLGWAACFLLSLTVGPQIQEFIGNYFIGSEEARISNYLLGDSGVYETGFRVDFILYSLIPIVVGFAFRGRGLKEDNFYNVILGTYITANAFWLLVIRAPYSDRIAYLSWFLLPMIILYPLIKQRDFISNRNQWVALAIFCMGAITIGLHLRMYF